MMAAHSGSGSERPGRYRFGDIVVDPAAQVLLRGGEPQPLEPKAFAVLLALLERPGELLGRDELLDRVWGHRHVTPGVLTRAIAQLRAALDDDSHDPRHIQTRHAVGYRFIGELSPDPAGRDGRAESAAAAEEGASAGAADGAPAPGAADDGFSGPAPGQATAPGNQSIRTWSPRAWLLAALFASSLALVVTMRDRDPGLPAPAQASIAILPFTNLGGDEENDYFAEGLAVELHDALAGVSGLKVAAQMSPAVAAARTSDIRELGEMLGVATVLDASVRRDGQRVRINARLSDCASGFTLWSRSYDRELSDIFDTQSEIAGEVVRALVDVLPPEQEELARRLAPTRSVAAFDSYLRGLQRLRTSETDDDARSAISHFEQALEADGDLAAAQAGICRSELWRFDNLREAGALERAREACANAERMAPDWPSLDLLIGDIHRHQGDLPRARERYARARSSPALLADVHMREGMLHAAEGRTEEAIAEFERARLARPGDPVIAGTIGFEQYRAGRMEDAIASYAEAVRLNPKNARMWSSLGAMYINAGRNEEALEAFNRSLALMPSASAYYNYGILMFYLGDYRKAADALRDSVRMESGHFVVWGALGGALLADPATAREAVEPLRRAREMGKRFLELQPADSFAQASYGWYSAVLGDVRTARASVLLAESGNEIPGEVALINAQTLTLVGSEDEVAERLAAARAAGVPDSRIARNPFIGSPAYADGLRDTDD